MRNMIMESKGRSLVVRSTVSEYVLNTKNKRVQ